MTAIRAIGLLSGGLDSMLAAKILLEQGIEVIGLHLESPTACRTDVHAVARELGVRLETRPKGEEYLRLLRHPRWGYGKNMNPCIDCRRFMFRVAAEYLEPFGARFVFSGEVVGQRPMSQMRASIDLIDRESGLGGWILRPLSAQLLDETEPERRGWVDRGRLYAVSGRSRTFQLELARRWGLTAFQSPGGGCLLTEVHYARRLRDLFEHVPEERTTMEDLALLRVGRHFRPRPDLKIVVGRDRLENQRLAEFARGERWLVEPVDFQGPAALVCGPCDRETAAIAARLVIEHARAVPDGARVRWREGEGWATHTFDPASDGMPDVLASAIR